MTARHDQVTSIGDAIALALESQRAEIHVAMPGQIVEYNAATQTATVRPQHLRAVPLDDGTYTTEQIPDIYDVPVLFPRAGAYSITFPVAAGDMVLLLFPHEDPARWRDIGEPCDPGDRRLHHVSGAVAMLGFYPTADAIPTHPTDRIRIRHGGIVTDFRSTAMEVAGNIDGPALASDVHDELVKIQTTLASIAGATFGTPYTAPVSEAAIRSQYIRCGG